MYRHRSLAVVAPPAAVLTVTEGKLRAGLDWIVGDPRDQLMASFIAAATAKVEEDTGVALAPRTVDVFYDTLPRTYAVPLPLRPVSGVTFSSFDSSSIRVPLAGAIYALNSGSAAPVEASVQLIDADAWPATLRAFQPWAIQIVAGFTTAADIPPRLLHAVALLVAHYATIGRDLVQIGHIVAETPLGYESIIAPYQLVAVG